MTFLKIIWDNIQALTLIATGVFALVQWRKNKDLSRAEFEKKLIEKVFDDESISSVMNIIDWDRGLVYNGNFLLGSEVPEKEHFENIELSVDKTLAHYSYICYLLEQRIFKRADMIPFEYALWRLFCNANIADYLFSLYHFSMKNKSNCPFYYLIDYGLKNDYLNESFRNADSEVYTNWLGE